MIVAGRFKGQKLSDLSDEEINYFLRVDAGSQTIAPVVSLPPFAMWCPDLSQYWFAKYELERRKPVAQRESAATVVIATDDNAQNIALKLAEYGYKAASRKYHPDHGGDTRMMQRLNAARLLARERLKD